MSTLPNVQPIYTKDILNWDARLTNQVCGRKLTVEFPVFLGSAGTFGSIIWNIKALPLGANVATLLRIFNVNSQENSLDNYRLLFEVKLPTITDVITSNTPIGINTNSATSVPTPVEIPLSRIYSRNTEESRGLILAPGQILYCGLSVPVANGWDVRIEGGHY